MCSDRLKFYFFPKRIVRSELFLLVPVPDRPVAQIRRVRHLFPRIYGVPVSHRIQHRPVQQRVSVRMRFPQLDLHRPRHHFHRSPFCLSIVRFTQHFPRVKSSPLLQPSRAHQHIPLHPARLQLALQRHRHHPRQRFHHPAHQHNFVSSPRVPFHPRHSLFEKRNRLRRLQNLLLPQAAKVALIPMRNRRQPARQQSRCRDSPSRVVRPPDRAGPSQLLKQSFLQRRLRHQRSVNVEKRPNAPLLFARTAHPTSPPASSPVRPCARLLARNFHPSSRTR